MRDDDQVFIFTKAELGLIKATFAGNGALLYAIRKVFLQFPLTLAERRLIKAQVTPQVLAVLRKRILPRWNEWYPLTQIPDFFSTLTTQMQNHDVESMAPLFAAKDLEESYLLQQFEVLADVDAKPRQPISLVRMRELTGKSPLSQYVNTTARNYLLGYIDPMLIHIKELAGTKEETPEQQAARLKRDSSK